MHNWTEPVCLLEDSWAHLKTAELSLSASGSAVGWLKLKLPLPSSAHTIEAGFALLMVSIIPMLCAIWCKTVAQVSYPSWSPKLHVSPITSQYLLPTEAHCEVSVIYTLRFLCCTKWYMSFQISAKSMIPADKRLHVPKRTLLWHHQHIPLELDLLCWWEREFEFQSASLLRYQWHWDWAQLSLQAHFSGAYHLKTAELSLSASGSAVDWLT